MDNDATEFFFVALHVISASAKQKQKTGASSPIVQSALDEFRQNATNVGTPADVVEKSKAKLCTVLDEVGLLSDVMRAFDDRMSGIEAQRQAASKLPAFKQKRCYTQCQMHEVLPKLFCGSWHPAADRDALKKAGVTHILCCVNVKARFPNDFQYKVLPAEDNDAYDISQHFAATNAFIADALNRGACLVHCGAGISRAPTIVAAYFIATMRIDAEAALSIVKKARTHSNPNPNFRRLLQKYAAVQ